VGPEAGLKAVEKKKEKLAFAGNRTPAIQPAACSYTD
jgi:hypothetical protein